MRAFASNNKDKDKDKDKGMTPLTDKQEALCNDHSWDFSDLKALFLNRTLKRSPELSHTEGLIQISKQIMEKTASRRS